MGRESRNTRRAEASRARRISTYVRASAAGSLWVAMHVHAAPPANVGPQLALPSQFQERLPPTQLLSTAPSGDAAQLSVLRKIEDDDFRVTGYLASRSGQAAPDYRLYLGLGYTSELGSLAKVTSHAFYGTGTYDGLNPNAGALPEDVRANGSLLGNWLGADWKVESRLWAGHLFSAGLEYREQLPVDVLDLNALTQHRAPLDEKSTERRMGMVTQNDVALSNALAMKVRMRYDERDGAFETLAPRVELVYKPEQTSSVSAIFDQTTSSPLTQPQAVSAWASPKTESDRIRNYELAYAKALGDTRGRVSYAWQETADGFAHIGNDSFGQHVGKLSLDVPILPKRLTTSFELQYIDVFGPLAGDRRSDFVIGNLTLASAALTGDTHVTVGMHNVFGAQASGSGSQWPAAVPTDGRSVRLDFTRKL